eukprot:3439916-Pyramimonas_sp.AAC.1
MEALFPKAPGGWPQTPREHHLQGGRLIMLLPSLQSLQVAIGNREISTVPQPPTVVVLSRFGPHLAFKGASEVEIKEPLRITGSQIKGGAVGSVNPKPRRRGIPVNVL